MKCKVLHIITRLDVGGSATNTIETVARLDKNRYDVDLVSGKTYDPKGCIGDKLKAKNISCMFVNDLCRKISPVKDIKAFFALLNIIKTKRYDIVHTHSSKAGILGRWSAKCAGVKIIVHTPHGNVFYGYFNAFVVKIFIMIERLTALITHRIITLTEIGADEHVAFKIAKRDKFITIYSGIDLDAYQASESDIESLKRELDINNNDIVFGSIARLTRVKGNIDLVGSFAYAKEEIPNAKLVLAGDGDQRDEIENKINDLKINDCVRLLGWKDNVRNILGAIDIFVLASLNEGMGRAVLEAMAAGKPVVATRVGGVPELVIDGKTGILVESQNCAELASAMIRLGKNREQIKSFGLEAKGLATDKFSIEKMVNDIDQLYYQLMEKNR